MNNIDTLATTVAWFQKAVPSPTLKNFSTQVGVHFEEVGEMIQELSATTSNAKDVLAQADFALKQLADLMKRDETAIILHEGDRKMFLDAICDQLVTASGSAYMVGMDVVGGLREVNRSNYSKFDKHGNPIFNENMKIMKDPDNYTPADLTPFV